MELNDLSVGELEQQLQEMEQSKADLMRAIEQRRQDEKHEIAQRVRDLVAEAGHDMDEILELLSGRRRRGGGAKKGQNRQYTRYVDPEDSNNVYVRGVIPGWMKQKMSDQGYDPSKREDREAFKANYLQTVND